MDRFYKMMKRNNKGFTLVELMVVLLILGILVAIAIPIYNKTQENARERACQANLRTIDGAIAQYYTAEESPIDTVTVAELVNKGYLKVAPQCPTAKADYTITGAGAAGKAVCPHTTPHTY
jgi:type IV pilus assembly protein PilA